MALIHDAISSLSGARASEPTALALDVVAAVAAIPLLAGSWTPIAGAAIAIAEIWIILSQHFSQASDPWTHILLAVLGAGLALLGPGAWSVDAHRFGRKLFVNGDGTRGGNRHL